MTSRFPLDVPCRAVLLDIEGTTSPMDFVYQFLFPYARAHVKEFLARHRASEEVQKVVAQLIEEHTRDVQFGLNPPAIQTSSGEVPGEEIVAYFLWLMDQDRKSTPLKSLQGKIWEEGYRLGELHSRVFADVPLAFKRWHEKKLQISIFSSGSVLAQKILFKNTDAGDLTGFISGFFDTITGAKSDPESYRRIAQAMAQPISKILFISDVTVELDAARTAGMQTVLCVRPGNHPQPTPHSHTEIHSLSELSVKNPII